METFSICYKESLKHKFFLKKQEKKLWIRNSILRKQWQKWGQSGIWQVKEEVGAKELETAQEVYIMPSRNLPVERREMVW